MSDPDTRIRVLWLAKGLGPGGMERLLVNHARTGNWEEFSYSAAYLVDRPNSVVPELEELGVTCTRFENGSGSDPRWLPALRRLAIDHDIDIIHVHSPMPAAMTRPLAKLMGRWGPKVIYTEHNTWDCYGRVTRLANAATYLLDDAQLAVSNDAKASVPSRLRRRVEVLTHGIVIGEVESHRGQRRRMRDELGLDDDEVVVITVAHLRTEKAYDIMLNAARKVVDEHPQAVFLSVGHGPLESDMRELHGRLGLGDRFRFLGFRSDVLDLMAGSDIFSLSSHQEGLPVSFMESTALGLPTVATAVGGLVDHVGNGVNGMLVSPGDSFALAEALGRVIEDPALREQLGKGALGVAKRFDAADAVRRQEQIYADLATSRRNRVNRKQGQAVAQAESTTDS